MLPPPRDRQPTVFSQRRHQGLRRAQGADQARFVGVVVPECQRWVLHCCQPEDLSGVVKQEGDQSPHFDDAYWYSTGTLQNTW